MTSGQNGFRKFSATNPRAADGVRYDATAGNASDQMSRSQERQNGTFGGVSGHGGESFVSFIGIITTAFLGKKGTLKKKWVEADGITRAICAKTGAMLKGPCSGGQP